MFYKRHLTDLTEEIDLAGGTYTGFLKMFAKTIKTTTSNERSLQNTGVRLLFLSKYNKEFHFMENTLPGEAIVQNKAVINAKVLSSLEDQGDKNDFESNLATLRSTLYSDGFYKNGELYRRWCEGFESLQLKGCEIPGPKPITELLTLAHETHFRLEIYMAMSRTSFVHTPGVAAALHRRLLFKKLLPLVREDRKVRLPFTCRLRFLCLSSLTCHTLIVSSQQTNAPAAHQQRMKALIASGYKPADTETTVVSDVELDDADFQ